LCPVDVAFGIRSYGRKMLEIPGYMFSGYSNTACVAVEAIKFVQMTHQCDVYVGNCWFFKVFTMVDKVIYLAK
jgi:hypothetical protein